VAPVTRARAGIQSQKDIHKVLYDNDAPTKVGATQIPRSVRILCTLFVAGFTHAASLVSSVVNPVHVSNGSGDFRNSGIGARTGLDRFEYLLLRIHL
jgi:hypothetical protein